MTIELRKPVSRDVISKAVGSKALFNYSECNT